MRILISLEKLLCLIYTQSERNAISVVGVVVVVVAVVVDQSEIVVVARIRRTTPVRRCNGSTKFLAHNL